MSFSSRRRQYFRYATLNIPAGFEARRSDNTPEQIFAVGPVRASIAALANGELRGTHWFFNHNNRAYFISNDDVEKHHMVTGNEEQNAKTGSR